MKKIIETTIEYVGMDDVINLLHLVEAVQNKGYYASVCFCVNYGSNIQVSVNKGEFKINEPYDMLEFFSLGDDKKDVESLHRAVAFLEQLRDEQEVSA